MTDNSKPRAWNAFSRGGLRAADLDRIDPHVRRALEENKRSGLLLAVRARWVALAITAILLPFISPAPANVMYYEVLLAVMAVIGWAQLRAGKVTQSRREILLMLCDLALLTFIMVVPSPIRNEAWPTAFQYQLAEFSYFYVLLALAALAYSWRTLVAFGTWTAGLWLLATVLVALFGTRIDELTANAAIAFSGYDLITKTLDPNNVNLRGRIQEVVVFLLVTGVLVVNARRNTVMMFRQAEATRERTNLARYFPPNLVDQMAARDQPLATVRSQNVAILFADIVGFTRMAEQQTPEEVVGFLRQYHARLEAMVFEHHGTLDKFLGDGLMATFGTPEPTAHDACNALLCARAMVSNIDSWNVERQQAGVDIIRISVGVHYGPVVLGDIGSERRLEYAVLGDTVNVASRLEALTRPLEVALVASDQLISAMRDEAGATIDERLTGLTESGPQNLRGRDQPVAVWTMPRI